MQSNELKDKLKELIRQRDALEQEALDISTRLTAPGMPGLKGGLIEKEVRGFTFMLPDLQIWWPLHLAMLPLAGLSGAGADQLHTLASVYPASSSMAAPPPGLPSGRH